MEIVLAAIAALVLYAVVLAFALALCRCAKAGDRSAGL